MPLAFSMLAMLTPGNEVWHLIFPEFPSMPGGVSEHSRVLVEAASSRGLDVHVWTAAGGAALGNGASVEVHPSLGGFGADDISRGPARCSTRSRGLDGSCCNGCRTATAAAA